MIHRITASGVALTGDKMQPNAANMCAGSPGKARLRTLASLDGRTLAARKVRGILRTLQAELRRKPTTVERAAMERVAVMAALAESARIRCLAGDTAVSLDDVIRADGCLRRSLRDLRVIQHRPLRRKAEPPVGAGLAAMLQARKATR